MFDWDNIRFFLQVARNGSIRRAAITLGVSHATVLRRIASMEDQLGVRLFERLPSGYQITSAGEEAFERAEMVEADALTLERQVFGRDTALTGSLRITMPQLLATHCLMPDLALFSEKYPRINLEINTSDVPLNLTKRQADIALRVAFDTPPEHLVGRKLVMVRQAGYASKELLKSHLATLQGTPLNWVVKEEDGPVPNWVSKPEERQINSVMVVSDPLSLMAAVQAGIGACVHFCFIGDPDPLLERLPMRPLNDYGELWILTHNDLRYVPRVQAFMKFFAEAILKKRALLEGN